MGQSTQTGLTSVTGSVVSSTGTIVTVWDQGATTATYTVPTGKKWIIQGFTYYNHAASATTLKFAGNNICNSSTAVTSITGSAPMVLAAAETIVMILASASSSVGVSYIEEDA